MESRDYKETLNLPRTAFPMKANLPKKEPEILAYWDRIGLYQRLLEARKDGPLFVLHDGPPYANGPVHIGTALNKILKDFIVRSRAMLGYRTPFVPGWDCNGMPIEHQVLRSLGDAALRTPRLELRALCREYATRYINQQRSEFRRLGVLGDWDHPYLTFDPGYSAIEVRVLRQLLEAGYIYRGLRPVHWCWSCRTALAEAEVEYRERVSPSIYVAFRLDDELVDPAALAADPAEGPFLAEAHRRGELFALIWTTTPWTIPANLGICLNEGFEYVALESQGHYYVVAAKLANAVEQACGLKVNRVVRLDGDKLRSLAGKDVFVHPIEGRKGRLMFSDHVSLDTGTGLVHTAPGHGYEDFVVGAQYGLKPFTPVDEDGIFTQEAPRYAGKRVFDANEDVIKDLRTTGALVHAGSVNHNYPHCWRCKNPVIFRATEQWFLNVDHRELRRRALKAIDEVEWIPRWSRDRIANMVEKRPDWCLSRQRAWGVPIPALRCVSCGEVTLDLGVVKRCEEIFAREGSDAWYIRPVTDFTGGHLRCPRCGADGFEKAEDILDVWFDSGCSHEAVLARREDLRWPADIYVEAVDQHRGWFQVSLLPAVALRDRAPYRAVLTHGLTLDELGRKMSKSLGNAEDAIEIVQRLGADVLRLVFASVDFTADMMIGETVISAAIEAYRKIRNSCRYLLGNLYDFEPQRDLVPWERQLEFDRFILTRLEGLKAKVQKAYEKYDFQASFHAILNFVVVDLSALYIDVVRDRLYCSTANSLQRRSAQTSLYIILDTLVRLLAPLIPFTAEEVYSHFVHQNKLDSVHLLELPKSEPTYNDVELARRWENFLALRSTVLKALEALRKSEVIGASLEAKVEIGLTEQNGRNQLLGSELSRHLEDLRELFIVSALSMMRADDVSRARLEVERATNGNFGELAVFDGKAAILNPHLEVLVIAYRAPGKKCPRCWTYFDAGEDKELCSRCTSVMAAAAI